jgi:hypothetical protein
VLSRAAIRYRPQLRAFSGVNRGMRVWRILDPLEIVQGGDSIICGGCVVSQFSIVPRDIYCARALLRE